MEITAAWAGQIEGSHVIIDGKVSRGAKDTATGRSTLHLLRAWVSSVGLSAGQRACADKSNELSTLPDLLASLQLKGTVVSIDAMAGHPEIAQQIHTAEGDWLLAPKANEKTTFETVSARFRALSGQDTALPEGAAPAAHRPHRLH